jgi:hypothetical protein
MWYKIILFLLFYCFESSCLSAQYKAIDINLNFGSADEELEESGSPFRVLSSVLPKQRTIGFSIPVSKRILITPKLGHAKSHNSYLQTNFDTLLVEQSTTSLFKSYSAEYLKIGVESTYWLGYDYQHMFFSAELQGLYNLSTNKYQSRGVNNIIVSSSNVSIDDEVRKFVPSLRLGTGFNVALIKYVNFYISWFIEVRPNSYYYDVRNYSKITRGIKLGTKFVLGGKSISEKARAEKKLDL